MAPSIMLALGKGCRNPCTVCVPSSLAKTDVFSSIILQAMLVVCIHALRLYLWFTLLLLPASFGHWVNTLTRCNNTHYEHCDIAKSLLVLWVISTIYIFVLIFLIKMALSIMLTLGKGCRNPCTVCVPSSLAKTDVFSSIILQAMLVVCIHALRLYLWFSLLLLLLVTT